MWGRGESSHSVTDPFVSELSLAQPSTHACPAVPYQTYAVYILGKGGSSLPLPQYHVIKCAAPAWQVRARLLACL